MWVFWVIVGSLFAAVGGQGNVYRWTLSGREAQLSWRHACSHSIQCIQHYLWQVNKMLRLYVLVCTRIALPSFFFTFVYLMAKFYLNLLSLPNYLPTYVFSCVATKRESLDFDRAFTAFTLNFRHLVCSLVRCSWRSCGQIASYNFKYNVQSASELCFLFHFSFKVAEIYFKIATEMFTVLPGLLFVFLILHAKQLVIWNC